MPRLKTDVSPCVRGHYGQWRRDGKDIRCRQCEVILCYGRKKAAADGRKNLLVLYEMTPGAFKKAGELLHMKGGKVRAYLTSQIWAPRWRITQIKAVLELCIISNGNGHKTGN